MSCHRAAMQTDNGLDVVESQTIAFHLMAVARRHSIELVEHILQFVMADAYAVVAYGYYHTAITGLPTSNTDFRPIARIFQRIVYQIANGIGYVDTVD